VAIEEGLAPAGEDRWVRETTCARKDGRLYVKNATIDR
jgi:hypothetical protein